MFKQKKLAKLYKKNGLDAQKPLFLQEYIETLEN